LNGVTYLIQPLHHGNSERNQTLDASSKRAVGNIRAMPLMLTQIVRLQLDADWLEHYQIFIAAITRHKIGDAAGRAQTWPRLI
jgi:hypothetical protein